MGRKEEKTKMSRVILKFDLNAVEMDNLIDMLERDYLFYVLDREEYEQ